MYSSDFVLRYYTRIKVIHDNSWYIVSITFYGGIGEVGGNKFFLKDGDTTVSLDFGMQMGKANQVWSEFQQPRRSNMLADLFEFELLPQVPGIYRTDFTKHMQWKDDWKVPDYLDAVVLSHAHVDHSEYLVYMRPSIPVYCSPESKLIMQGFDEMGTKEYMGTKDSFITYKNKKGNLSYTSGSSKRTKTPREFVMFENHKKFKIGSIEFEPIHIDHSLPGTYAFLIYTSSGIIAYTADIRFHGSHPERSNDFVKSAASAGVDLILCEGTRLKPDDKTRLASTESDVERLVSQRFDACKSLAVCTYPPRDLDRFMSFYNAAKTSGRKLAIDMRQAYTLQLFDNDPMCHGMYPSVDDETLSIFIPRRNSGIIGRTNPSRLDYDLMIRNYPIWARDIVKMDNAINYISMVDDHKSYALYVTDYSLNNLIDVKPQEGATYIRSQTEPFNEEMAQDHLKVKRWLVHFNLIKPDPQRSGFWDKKYSGVWDPIHVSGHGNSEQISKMVADIVPKKLIPIHTEVPELFGPLHDDVIQVKLGETYEF